MSVPEVSVDELAIHLDAGARLVDVREHSEYVAGHVPGAILVPLSSVPDHPHVFEGPGPVYLVCRTGARSGRACEYLNQLGHHTVNVAGGTMAWVGSGRPVVEGELPA
jgi:rhodanese-related sulfurtransferase